MKARVWAYRDGTLLPDGFEAESTTGKGYDDDAALVPCLIALLESVGIEVCIGNDDATNPKDFGFNEEVEEWEDVTEWVPGWSRTWRWLTARPRWRRGRGR